ncbi:MAG: TusE/DsrC/DsvC family sulfur relay protein [Gammaproteobacteria bacterium]|nr:TusE/DsrC/DsvC family sulfur relay protein [Gammaproteobacteria bacterium]MDE0412645.1 TusE/DsrC/DsvC family sulfur relay protein [Gammaproteobacteria bacterium]
MTALTTGENERSFMSEDWSDEDVRKVAAEEGITLTDDHFEVMHALQEYYSRHEINLINMRELHDALEEKFHYKGGLKYLYDLFPGGPIAQGCKMAGLHVPAGAVDKGFGSVA